MPGLPSYKCVGYFRREFGRLTAARFRVWSVRKRRRVCTGSPLPGPLGLPVTCPTALEMFCHFRSFLWPVLAPSARLVFQQSKEEPPFLKTSAGPALASFLDGSLQKNEHHRGPAMKGLEKFRWRCQNSSEIRPDLLRGFCNCHQSSTSICLSS